MLMVGAMGGHLGRKSDAPLALRLFGAVFSAWILQLKCMLFLRIKILLIRYSLVLNPRCQVWVKISPRGQGFYVRIKCKMSGTRI